MKLKKAIISDRLKELLEESGETQAALAKAIGISTKGVNYLVAGINGASAEILIRIAEHYNVTTDWILGRLPHSKPVYTWVPVGETMIIQLSNCLEQYEVTGNLHRTILQLRCPKCRMITLVDDTIRYDYCPHCGEPLLS